MFVFPPGFSHTGDAILVVIESGHTWFWGEACKDDSSCMSSGVFSSILPIGITVPNLPWASVPRPPGVNSKDTSVGAGNTENPTKTG